MFRELLSTSLVKAKSTGGMAKKKDVEMGPAKTFSDEEGSTGGHSAGTSIEGVDELNSETKEERKRRLEEIVPYLASRSFHLPGNGWCRDWFQYVIANNHTFFSLFCAHKDHPVTNFERVLIFLASLTGSLVISNGFYIIFLIKDNGHLVSTRLLQHSKVFKGGVVCSNYEFAVMTIGALMHSLFNYTIWQVAACGCCEAGGCLSRCQKLSWSGTVALGMIVTGTSVLGVLLFLLQETIANGREGIDKDADANYTTTILNQGLIRGINLSVALFADNSNALTK